MKNTKTLIIKINIKSLYIILNIYIKKFVTKIIILFHRMNFLIFYLNVKNSMEMKYIVFMIFYMKI